MKIVLDTNIIVSACMGSLPANRLIFACLQGKFTPLISNPLLTEYEDLINRNELFTNSNLSLIERNELLDALLIACQWTEIHYNWRPNLKDEGDNFLIELAVAGNAQYLVTRNLKDFRQAELLFNSFTVCLPETLLEDSK